MASSTSIEDHYRKFILEDDHPCIMSKSVFISKNYELHTYKQFGSKESAKKILVDLKSYLGSYNNTSQKFFSFIAVFEDKKEFSEIEFEQLLWKQLQLIHSEDPVKWDLSVSNDPNNQSFSFSILGSAFYVIGMHANSSRNARKSPKPTLVFNLHSQFERLREMGVYQKVRDRIRNRDLRKNGSINPMMMDFGKRSEAPQYSGRHVDSTWECPFNPKPDR